MPGKGGRGQGRGEFLPDLGREPYLLPIVFVIFFFESWVEDIDITKYPGDVEDLDRPGVLNLTGKITVKERTSRSYAAFVQSAGCRRRFFADYLGDKTAEG